MDRLQFIWSDYLRYRAELRGFRLERIEEIVRYSTERYTDSATGRRIAVGDHDSNLVIVPYDVDPEGIVPVTIHVTSRRQIQFRVRTGRLAHE